MSETEKKERKQSEASKVASLVRAYYAAIEKRNKAYTAQEKAGRRFKDKCKAVDAAQAACAEKNVKVDSPSPE